MPELTAKRVHNICNDCLAGVPPGSRPGIILIKGIVYDYCFDSKKLEKHKEEITKMLDELSTDFRKDGGGGMSFLQACVDKNGHQWGEHQNIEQLFCLGIAGN